MTAWAVLAFRCIAWDRESRILLASFPSIAYTADGRSSNPTSADSAAIRIHHGIDSLQMVKWPGIDVYSLSAHAAGHQNS
jgi:hypothetical protein